MRTGNNYSGARFRYSTAQRAPKRKGCIGGCGRMLPPAGPNYCEDCDEREAQRVMDAPDRCPVCYGVVELTPSGFLTCREHGSEHYRVRAADA